MSAARVERPVRVGVVGAGGWGRNHLRVLKSLPEVELVGVSDRVPERRRAAESEEGVRGFEDLAALAREGLDAVTIAVPTGHLESALRLAPRVEAIVCANVRGGGRFAVADAYESWCDVSEEEAARALGG